MPSLISDAVVTVVKYTNLKKVMPNFRQPVCCQWRKKFGPLLYAIQERLQASLPPFVKSDHAAIFLLPG